MFHEGKVMMGHLQKDEQTKINRERDGLIHWP